MEDALAEILVDVDAPDLPDRDLAYIEEGAEHFNEYVEAVGSRYLGNLSRNP